MPAQQNNLMVNESRGNGNYNDLFNPNFAKTEISSKNGSLDFGELKSGFGGDSTGFGSKGHSVGGSDRDSNGGQTSPRSPVGRTDKKKESMFNKGKMGALQNEGAGGLLKKNFNVEENK